LHAFDPGYVNEPYASLVQDYPEDDVYPVTGFRVEWGPIFHRGRLDGSARVLVLGQDPAQHEAMVRRILVGTAGRRLQGFLGKLGIETSYVMTNAFLYSVYGQQAGAQHLADKGIADYRNAWLDALMDGNPIDAVVALGTLADRAFRQWRKTAAGQQYHGAYRHVLHPTYPDSAAARGTPFAQAMRRMLEDWNEALDALAPAITHPDVVRPPSRYGTTLKAADLGVIPAADLPAGLPAWMRSDRAWADRVGANAEEKRATIVVRIPEQERPF
jgi:uracil-DNA glycosylase